MDSNNTAQSLLARIHNFKDLYDTQSLLKQQYEKNDHIAQYLLYSIKNDEIMGDNGKSEALYLCLKAAEHGYAPAQYDLALHYLYGDGIEQNTLSAIQWLEKSGANGYYEAARKLSTLYHGGTYVRRNDERSDYWSEIAGGATTEELGELLPVQWDYINPETEEEKHSHQEIIEENRVTLGQAFTSVEQSYVITADSDRSFVINAGPGTGKTYSLIHRINHLVNSGVDPDEIIVLSFTNAVVNEVRGRLRELAKRNEADRAIRNVFVRTYHSFAYWLLKMANENIDAAEWEPVDLNFNHLTYDKTLVLAAELINKIPDIASSWKYLIVDEIQDINNEKALFVSAVLKTCIQNDCPFMFLGDSCQAIYDYLNERYTGDYNITAEDFYHDVLSQSRELAEFVSFEVNHRQIPLLQKNALPLREIILFDEKDEYKTYTSVLRKDTKSISFDELESFLEKHSGESVCLMFRGNFLAKFASKNLNEKNIDHYCVLNDVRNAYPRWIGEVFSTIENTHLTEELLEHSCAAMAEQYPYDFLWQRLQKICDTQSSVIKLDIVHNCLRMHLLDNLFEKEKKHILTISNVHRSKGLEYDIVIMSESLLRSGKYYRNRNLLYVALTRPRSELYSLINEPKITNRIKKKYYNKRDASKLDHERYQYIEIIGDDKPDIGPGNFVFAEMDSSQSELKKLKTNDPVYIEWNQSYQKFVIVSANSKIILGFMSEYFTNTMSRIHRNCSKRLIKLDQLYIDGIYTHIESVNDIYQREIYHLKDLDNVYTRTGIWNYAAITGPALAIYED